MGRVRARRGAKRSKSTSANCAAPSPRQSALLESLCSRVLVHAVAVQLLQIAARSPTVPTRGRSASSSRESMGLEVIYICRHAFRMSTELHVGACEPRIRGEARLSCQAPNGTLRDPPLTAHGVAQTRELAVHLGKEPIERIYSSPYWRYASASPVCHTDTFRCLQTASPVAEALKLRILVEAGIACVIQS